MINITSNVLYYTLCYKLLVEIFLSFSCLDLTSSTAPFEASAASAAASSASHIAILISSYTWAAFKGSAASSLVAANNLK